MLNNNSMNITYLNNNFNNTILNESNNNINNEKNNLRYNNIKLNQTFNSFNSPIQKQNINVTSSFSPKNNKKENILNKTFSNSNRQNIIKNNINSIKEENSLENENTDDSIPQLSNNILDKLSPDCIKKYNVIINFIMEESNNIKEELIIFNNQKNTKNKFDILRESGQFLQYNNIFNKISMEENNKSDLYLRNINSKSKIFEMIKKNCEQNFNFIEKYSDRNSIVISKLNEIINSIEDYNIKFFSKNNLNSYNILMNNNIENIMNNTINIDNKNNKLYNNMKNNSFINTFRSDNFYNHYIHNLSHI